MARTTTSLRLDDELREKLQTLAHSEGMSLNALVERMLREGVAMEEHPGIVFRTGYSGRRASLAAGADVWQIAFDLKGMAGTEEEKLATLAYEFNTHKPQIRIALDYMAAHRDEIDEQVEANERAGREVERLEAERKRLLA